MKRPGSAARGRRAAERPTLTPEVQVDVVAESVHQDELLALTGGRRLWSDVHRRVLARLDPAAVAVMIGDHLVGHLPRNAARPYRPIIAEAITGSGGATCLAEIRGGWERAHGDVGLFGVILSLPRLERRPGTWALPPADRMPQDGS